jgi:hypothetical protein
MAVTICTEQHWKRIKKFQADNACADIPKSCTELHIHTKKELLWADMYNGHKHFCMVKKTWTANSSSRTVVYAYSPGAYTYCTLANMQHELVAPAFTFNLRCYLLHIQQQHDNNHKHFLGLVCIVIAVIVILYTLYESTCSVRLSVLHACTSVPTWCKVPHIYTTISIACCYQTLACTVLFGMTLNRCTHCSTAALVHSDISLKCPNCKCMRVCSQCSELCYDTS